MYSYAISANSLESGQYRPNRAKKRPSRINGGLDLDAVAKLVAESPWRPRAMPVLDSETA